jgi:hypothetical protein
MVALRRFVRNFLRFICALSLYLALSTGGLAQITILPEWKMAPWGTCARLSTSTASESVDKNREPFRSNKEKAEIAGTNQFPMRFGLFRQSSLTCESADEWSTQPADQTGGPANKEETRKGALIIAPYPIANPALGTGLQWVIGYVFRLNKEDKVTPPSFFGTVGMITSNGSGGMIVGGNFHLKDGKYRVVAAVAKGNVNFDFYGIGKLAGDRGLFLPININGKGIGAQMLLRITKGLYIGPRFQLRQLSAQIDFKSLSLRGLPDASNKSLQDIVEAVPRDLFSARTVAIGPHLQRDTRNDQFYPTQGTILNVGGDLFLKALGSKFDYQTYQARFESYNRLSERQVLAIGSIGCAATGDRVPIYDLCLYGAKNYVRGYSVGRFQDRRMLATQLEYRLRLPKLMGIGLAERFGVVGFGGVGWVGKQFGDLAFDTLLPGAGAGLRFRLTKKYPINFRLDYGIGKLGHTVSMGVGEAF